MTWPTELVSLTRCAELFTAAGKQIDRTNLGRWIDDNKFPFTDGPGGAKLVNAGALWELWAEDFTRQVMSGASTAPIDAEAAADEVAIEPAAPAEAPDDDAGDKDAPAARASRTASRDLNDPRRQSAALEVQQRRLALAKQLNQVVPVEEVAAAMGDAVALLRAEIGAAVPDEADLAVQELGLPSTKTPIVRRALKRFGNRLQERFAARLAKQGQGVGETEAEARARMEKLVDVALDLRGASTENTDLDGIES